MRLIRKQPSLDSSWIGRFRKFGSFQPYGYLEGDKEYRENQKKLFLNGDIQNPILDYPKLDLKKLKIREKGLLDLKGNILANEPNPVVKEAYLSRIREKLDLLKMLQAIVKKDMVSFKKYSERVYGKPSLKVFAYVINKLQVELKIFLSSSKNFNHQQIAKQLGFLLPEIKKTKKIDLPSTKTVQLARRETLQSLSSLITMKKVKDIYAAEDIKKFFEQALQTLRLKDWDVMVDKSSKISISVDQEHKKIRIPESRRVLFKRLRALVVHEIGTHVIRRINGERSKLSLLGFGLAQYGKGEEGIATMREQAIEGEVKDFKYLDRYLAISLACGLDGVQRDFRQTYEIMKKYYLFKEISSLKDLTVAGQKAKERAWKTCLRTFRGTDCSTKGACFTKDIVYAEGNIMIWKLIEKNPEELKRFNIGKYDPVNPKHVFILKQLGIINTC